MKAQNIVQGGMLDTEEGQKAATKKFIRGMIRQEQRPLLLARNFVKKYVSKKLFSYFFSFAIFLFIRKQSASSNRIYCILR